jgi:hypothetical protein
MGHPPLPDPTFRARHFLVCPVRDGIVGALTNELVLYVGPVESLNVGGGCAWVLFERPQGENALRFCKLILPLMI